MNRKLTSAHRQKRELHVPRPHRKGNIKIPYEGWLEAAKVVLIEEGIGNVKVDRLARRLKVTRGGFYYHFKSHHALLEDLLKRWRTQNGFVTEGIDTSTPRASLEALNRLTDILIHERGFDPQFDLAVREWARISIPVAEVVSAVDEERIQALTRILLGLGCKPKEADIRAKVFYYHQIGYYALGVHESTSTREANLPTYLAVLCGENYVEAAAKADGGIRTGEKPARWTSR
ncbi:MAG TPA: TetR/AcrR family transcriptional regulator [Nevskiaceae bacterium]|nr:TetR/AcrR family transcriptional regulator [Nevskiaceae bacterium]